MRVLCDSFVRLLLLGLVLYLGAWAYRIVTRKYYVWLPGYVRWLVTPGEAGGAAGTPLFPLRRPFRARRGRDHDGALGQRVSQDCRPPSRQRRAAVAAHLVLSRRAADRPQHDGLQKLVAGGYGETELHLHHFNDTQESARERFQRGDRVVPDVRLSEDADGATHFGFVHGNWSLDNSRGNAFCGNNRELAMLRELGCFADFTFSSIFEESQPPSVNNIYEATDDDRSEILRSRGAAAGGREARGRSDDLPGAAAAGAHSRPAKLFVEVENAEIHPAVPVTPRRVDAWVRANIHVEGRPDWRFIKIHTHGASRRRTPTRFWDPSWTGR